MARARTRGRLRAGSRRARPRASVHRKAEGQRDEARRALEIAGADIIVKDRLIAMVSHELRTPLTPALVAATLLEQATRGDEHLHKLAETVRRNIELEAALVDDLLEMARIGRAQVPLHSEIVNVHQVVEDAVEICKAGADEKRVTIAVDLTAEYPHTSGDEARLRQVVWNLLINATKFSEPGGIVQMRTLNPSDGLLRVTVLDAGAGMDRNTLASLFSPFGNLWKTPDSSPFPTRFEPAMPHGGARRGLGLGLTICKGIVDAHGGRIWATSEGPGRGSTFEVELQTVTPAQRSAGLQACQPGGPTQT